MRCIHVHILAVGCKEHPVGRRMSRWEWIVGVIVVLCSFTAFQLVEYHLMLGRVPSFRKGGLEISPVFNWDGFQPTPGWSSSSSSSMPQHRTRSLPYLGYLCRSSPSSVRRTMKTMFPTVPSDDQPPSSESEDLPLVLTRFGQAMASFKIWYRFSYIVHCYTLHCTLQMTMCNTLNAQILGQSSGQCILPCACEGHGTWRCFACQTCRTSTHVIPAARHRHTTNSWTTVQLKGSQVVHEKYENGILKGSKSARSNCMETIWSACLTDWLADRAKMLPMVHYIHKDCPGHLTDVTIPFSLESSSSSPAIRKPIPC